MLLKPETMPPKPFIRSQIADGPIRRWCIPAFGIVIPNLTGLFGPLSWQQPQYWLGYLYFIFISFSIWHGNRWFLFKQREHYNWFHQPFTKLTTLLFANVFYTAPLTVLLCWIWYKIAGFDQVDWQAIQQTSLLNVMAVIVITHIYETVFLISERESDQLQFEKLERAKAQAELQALKTQIDPHFMFNSLNTLSYLIEYEPKKALQFNETLADVYRYILFHKNRDLVELTSELSFLQNYYSLLRIRFDHAIQLQADISQTADWLIPPISLQVLLENAVKHNEFDEQQPLVFHLNLDGEYLRVHNNCRKKSQPVSSTQLGLQNLNERYVVLTRQAIETSDNAGSFTVLLPLVKVST